MTIIQRAVDCYGPDNQIIKAIEEMSELQHALARNLIGDHNLEEVAEEMADVQIMLEQLLEIYDNKDLIRYFTIEKLKRLRDRILKEEDYED